MKKNVVLGVVAALVPLAAGYVLVRYTFVQPGALPTHINPNAVCLACQKDQAVTPKLSEAEPWTCPQCSQRSVYSWLYCPDCKQRFVPNLERRSSGLLRPPIMPACPKCGTNRVTAFDPFDPQQTGVGSLPLPKWP